MSPSREDSEVPRVQGLGVSGGNARLKDAGELVVGWTGQLGALLVMVTGIYVNDERVVIAGGGLVLVVLVINMLWEFVA